APDTGDVDEHLPARSLQVLAKELGQRSEAGNFFFVEGPDGANPHEGTENSPLRVPRSSAERCLLESGLRPLPHDVAKPISSCVLPIGRAREYGIQACPGV